MSRLTRIRPRLDLARPDRGDCSSRCIPCTWSAADGPALPQGMQAPSESVTLPAFELPAPDGSVVRAADLEGKVVVVRFWASW